MTCELCGKENAVVRIRQIIGSESREMRICESCAREKGIIGNNEEGIGEGVAWLLQGLFERIPGKSAAGRTCPVCGTRARDIRSGKRVGCGGCFTTFAKEIRKILKIHEDEKTHKGKLPKRIRSYTAFMIDRENLKSRLEAALAGEEYELAAQLRDKISRIAEPSGEEQ